MGDRILLDEEGNEVTVPDQETLEALQKAFSEKEELASEMEKLSKEIEELKKGVSPDWSKIRPQLKKLEELKAQGVTLGDTKPDEGGENKPGEVEFKPEPSVEDIVDKQVRKQLISTKRDEYLGSLPEDKRETVKEVFNSLTKDKELSNDEFSSYMTMATQAIGLNNVTNPIRAGIASSNGAVPPDKAPGPTEAQKELAKKFGNDPEKLYGEGFDTSNMLNPEKFVKQD